MFNLVEIARVLILRIQINNVVQIFAIQIFYTFCNVTTIVKISEFVNILVFFRYD